MREAAERAGCRGAPRTDRGGCVKIDDLAARLRAFARERDWEQFHAPKNLAMALAVEAAELMEHFQWLTERQSAELTEEARRAVAAELADVFIYTVRLADRLGVDLEGAVEAKILVNAAKYPVEKSRGSVRKYTELG
jgi:NTP pyrophosphatase (non-canonical NTP hydrolase)